jgi:hypothetical protein
MFPACGFTIVRHTDLDAPYTPARAVSSLLTCSSISSASFILPVKSLAYNGRESSLTLWPHLHPFWLSSRLNAKLMD